MDRNRPIAIIGMAGRFPDAPNIASLHQNLLAAKCSIREISADRIQQTTLSAEQDYYRAGFVEGIDRFDHELFHLSLGEAQCMDPHQRQLLEVVYELMENAGYSPQQMAESDTSVFVADKNLYYYRHAEEYNTLLVNGNSSECLAAYLSRQFNLQGSTAVIDTSCSSSLVALHHACNELLLGDAERAIVCGASYDLFPFREGDIDLKVESPDGRSIPFSDRSNGMVYGEAAVAVLLKPLEQALADGDHIQATILSTAVNNNAFRSASLNAPDSVAQAQVLQKAWRKAGIEPSDLAFVEAHGSGTRLGDNIEVGGLNLAFAATAPERSACPISTIKANIGHTRCVAGLAGLVKVALALKHEVIYPAHYTGVSSPLIDFDRAAVYVNQEAIDWPGGGERPRVAGLSSFGFSGTNCHVVLAEAPLPTAHANVPNSAARYCIPLTAHHAAGLLANAQALLDYLPQLTEADLPSLSKVLGSGRDQHAYRRTLLVSELEDLRRQLSRLVRELTEQAPVPTPDTQVIGVFSDDASLVLGDLEKWGQRFPVFQSCFARGEALRRELGQSPTAAYCNLMFQWGLAEQLRAFGLAPQKLLGLGLGKQTAQLLRQERSLIECLQAAFTYEPEAITALEQRARRLLERESSVGATLFLSMNPRNPIVDQLAQLTTGEERLTCFNWSSAAPAAFGELLAALHRTGQTLDWSAAFDYLPARRMELPTSSFAPTRCWIRETPSDFSETESSSDTEALEADWTALQIGLATIWKRVLELETLQLQDDFFELGGDSLQATKVIQSLNHDYGLQLDFEDIFDFPTLEGLAQYIHENLSNVQRLMIAWKEVLKVDQIGLDEDFFSIGGHSLLANQILNRIDYYFGLRLDFEDFFKYPTIRGMADYLDHRQKVSRTIPVLPPSEHYALSPNQKRLWAVCQSEESAAAYNELNCYLLEGEVRPDLLERALAAVIERHESLRTVFVEHEGETRQKILPPRELNFQIDYRDLSQTPEARSVADAELVRFRQLPFNFQDGPLCKALLFRLEKGRYLLGLNIHHIVFDDWSFEIMSHEMAIHYRALLKGQGSPLRPLEFQYKEMAAWMNTELSGERLLAQEKFWLDKLAAPLPVLELPTDFPRPALKTFKGAKERYTIEAELIDAIRRVSQREGVSVFMTLTTALLVQLHRYSGQKELILGLPVAGRGLLELENQVGFYTNTVSLLTRWEEDLRLSDFLQLVKENMLDVYRHQLYPLDALVEQLDRRVDQSRGALFDLLVVYKKVTEGGEPLDLPFSIQIEEAKQLHSGFDLEFSWIELPDGLEVSIIYNPDLYRQTTIDRYFTHFRNLLQHFTTDLEVRLNTLDYLGAAERAQLRAPAPSQSPSPTDRAFHGLMERAAQSPQALAIAYGRQRYTYAELWENVQLRMAELHAREASPQQKLALYFTDRYEAISTLWAALYLGHDCLLLPNDWPSPYVQAFLQELNPTALLSDTAAPVADASTLAYSHYRIGSQSADEATLPTPASTPGRLLLWESETAEGPQVHPLSGTRLLAQLDWLEEHLVFDAHTVLLQTTSPSSPLGLLEILATLRRGGTLVLSDQDQPAELLELINTRGVTHWCFDPQELEAILTLGETPSESLWSLRQAYTYLVEGAEETRKKLARTASPQQWQCYGHPALAPLVAAGPWTPESESLFCAPVLPGLAVELRDAAGQLLPLGTWGDLYQATAPARTRGDRLRWTEVGQLEWWGSQVAWSLRGGQRLAEEAWATRLLGERKDILLALRTIAGEMRAYLAPPVVGQALPERLVEEWQREWRARYPKAWLPDCIHQLDHLPQTETGRVDWTAIDRWERERELAANYTEPRGELEVKIHQIWSTVLHVDRIGVHDNFFEIGGNSLLSLRITSMIYRDLALKLSMTDVFEHPTIRQLAQRVGDRRVEPVAAIPVAPSADQYVLSRAQRRMWILSHLGEGTATYNMYKTCRVRGPVDRQRLEEAFRALIRRQESLRTAIVVVDGEAFSRIRPAAELPFKLRYRDYTDAEIPLEKAKAEAQRMAVRPFQLDQLPLFRVKLMRVAAEDYVFVLVIHHIIADGWSVDILVNELFVLYGSALGAQVAPLPELAIQYKDYATWEHGQLARSAFARQAQFWKKEMASPLPVLELPTDFSRPEVQTNRGSSTSFFLGTELSDALATLANRLQATPFMGMMAGLLALFHRYSGQTDIILGTPVSGREHPDLEHQIGLFVNTIPLRQHVQGHWNFGQLLRQVKKRSLRAFAHQDYPFDQIVDQLELTKDTSRSPLFDVLVVWDDIDLQTEVGAAQDAVLVEDFPIGNVLAKFDLTFHISQTDRGLAIGLSYNSDLFLPERIERMLVHLRELMTGLLEDPQLSIAEAKWESPDEAAREAYFAELSPEARDFYQRVNATEKAFPDQEPFTALFEKMVHAHPQRIAVEQNGRAWTYEALARASHQLGAHLLERGVQKEDLVAVFCDRSIETLTALLALFKIGAIYIPFTTDLPEERLRQLIEDNGIKCLLTTNDTLVRRPELEDAKADFLGLIPTLRIDQLLTAPLANTSPRPWPFIASDDLAYLIFTSGSTGKPKGAMVEHVGMINHMYAMIEDMEIDENSVVVQNASQSFDISVWQFLIALAVGGRTLIYDSPIIKDPLLFIEKINADQPTILELVPSYLAVLQDYQDDWAPLSLRYLAMTGEALKYNLVQRWFEENPDIPLVNYYGPTEVSDDITSLVIDRCPEDGPISIGKPIQNMRIYIVDEAGQLRPPGVKGEIYTSGIGVGRGYLNNPEKTKAAFGWDVYRTEPGVKLYRTGDIGAYRWDGNIEFWGRKDHQVKVSGHRIELGEIEHAMIKIAGVKEAVVSVAERGESSFLCAYFQREDPEGNLGADQLRKALQDLLPQYMVPSYFIEVERFPLTPHGKIDRKALPAPDLGAASERVRTEEARPPELEAPKASRSKLEILLNGMEHVLQQKAIAAEQNFFALGGDSILAIQLVAQLNREGYKLRVMDVFNTPVLAQMAPLLEAVKQKAEQGTIEGPVPLSPIQHQFFQSDRRQLHHYNQALTIQSTTAFEVDALQAAFDQLLLHHDALRLSFQCDAAGQWQQYNQGAESRSKLVLYDLRPSSDTVAKRLAICENLQRSFTLHEGPLVKAALFREQTADRLLLIFHHLLIDGISWRIVLEDFEALYRQALAGDSLRLPQKTDSFQLWCRGLVEYAQAPVFEDEIEYWQELVGTTVPALPLRRREDQRGSEQISFRLDAERSQQLTGAAHRAYGTEVNEILLAALTEAFAESMGVDKVWIMMEGHGREEIIPDLQCFRTVGWFTSEYPVLLENVASSEEAAATLIRTKDFLRQLPRKGIGYGIARYLRPELWEGEVAQFHPSVIFNFLGQFGEAEAATGEWQIFNEAGGAISDPEDGLDHPLQLAGMISDGQLLLTIEYDRQCFAPEQIRALSQAYQVALERLIDHCVGVEDTVKTISDFGYRELAMEDLEDLFD